MKDVLVANTHTGGIVFPRRTAGGISLPNVRIAPGAVQPVPAELWETVKKNPIVQAWLDRGVLKVVKKADARVDIASDSTVDTEALIATNAPHLADATEEESTQKQTEGGNAVKAGVRKKNKGVVTVD